MSEKERREIRKRRRRQRRLKGRTERVQPLPASCPALRRALLTVPEADVSVLWPRAVRAGRLRNGAVGPEPAECRGSAHRPGTEGRVALASARQSSPTRAPTSIMASPRVGFSRPRRVCRRRLARRERASVPVVM